MDLSGQPQTDRKKGGAMFRVNHLKAISFSLVIILAPLSVHAEKRLSVCNQTLASIEVAVEYVASDTGRAVTKGWTLVPSGECEIVASGVSQDSRYVRYHARTNDLVLDLCKAGDLTWGSIPSSICIRSDGSFNRSSSAHCSGDFDMVASNLVSLSDSMETVERLVAPDTDIEAGSLDAAKSAYALMVTMGMLLCAFDPPD